MNKKRQFRLSALTSTQIILLGICGDYFWGGAAAHAADFVACVAMDALFGCAVFTATSATCVTGLIVVYTAGYWSLFGQIVDFGADSDWRHGVFYHGGHGFCGDRTAHWIAPAFYHAGVHWCTGAGRHCAPHTIYFQGCVDF